ncbi:cbb3-type cytochrome c oxidase subunit 3 [Tateyamaria pelophila]|uniref:cbb3-type cytochrome c oxidase subunit 3 n=1 Tax=Tateyamaria pelophila TaxID=328415 RepID=UPI001CBD952C|nr:cbb3-type cytochrome c oxidase subunit 3 [Tateyamaria pelophila]
METYSLLREFADSWMLLVMFSVFVGVAIWVFRPWARDMYRDTAEIPFRHDDAPMGPEEDQK